jgi:hypothetical protein
MSESDESKGRCSQKLKSITKDSRFRKLNADELINNYTGKLLAHLSVRGYDLDNLGAAASYRERLRLALNDRDSLVASYRDTVKQEAKLDRAYHRRLMSFRILTAFFVPFVAIVGLSLGAALLKCFGVDVIALNLLRVIPSMG